LLQASQANRVPTRGRRQCVDLVNDVWKSEPFLEIAPFRRHHIHGKEIDLGRGNFAEARGQAFHVLSPVEVGIDHNLLGMAAG